jgi:amino acid adenylation domain-containing protein
LIDGQLGASAARHPARTAIVDGSRTVSYAELEAAANRLAALLRETGVGRGDRVGLYLEKSLESLVGIFGILRAGAAYVPLDPAAPVPRLAGIARDAGIRCLLTAGERAESWPGLVQEGAPIERLLVLDAVDGDVEGPAGVELLTSSALEGLSAAQVPDESRSEDDLAYILYTSGSTGVPKGVMLSHRNALAFVDWAVDEFQVGETDVLSSHAPLHFDLSIFDLFAATQAGAAIVLVPSELALFPIQLARWMRESGITVWYSVPSILTMLALRGKLDEVGQPTLRTILFAGEVFPTKYLHRLMELLPDVRFANLYGPTETNVCTWYEVPRWSNGPPESIPIGRAIANVEVYAVTDEGAAAPPGEVGELLVRGPTVMHGYWGDRERTSRSLIETREPDGSVSRIYRTGDLARLDEGGDWIFLGRRDAQIKSRGYRIELGDIEAALAMHPAVRECAAVAVPDELVTNRIKAVVVAEDGLDQSELAAFCQARLPRYMVPELVEFRSELPRTSTGKIDRVALQTEGPTAAVT